MEDLTQVLKLKQSKQHRNVWAGKSSDTAGVMHEPRKPPSLGFSPSKAKECDIREREKADLFHQCHWFQQGANKLLNIFPPFCMSYLTFCFCHFLKSVRLETTRENLSGVLASFVLRCV
ncbi:hypothetical protein TNCT_645051 [Trichonephila clavata]|uniref:Uncharacterized protein n=1 Tax=Trichonephila clavata TaxID=2740835 RepID=A0A8X6F6U5_TRICU|nr:hypothetical protein TNCT_645051 [Trichonephila clavata]